MEDSLSPSTPPPPNFPIELNSSLLLLVGESVVVCSVAKVIQCTGPQMGKDSLHLEVFKFHRGPIQTWTTWK